MDPRVLQMMQAYGIDEATAISMLRDPASQIGPQSGPPGPGDALGQWGQAAARMSAPNSTGGPENPDDPAAQAALQAAQAGGPPSAPDQIKPVQAQNAPEGDTTKGPDQSGPPPPGAPPSPAADASTPAPGAAPGSPPATNGPAAPGGAPAQAVTPSTAGAGFVGTPEDRQRDVYGLRDNDTLEGFGRRVFQQGLQDNGSSLFTNPSSANSPWASFLLNRYSGDVGSKMASMIGTGQVEPGQEGATASNMMKSLTTGGGGSPAGGVSFGDLKALGDAFGRYASGDQTGMNTSQSGYLKGHQDDYGGMSNMFVNAARDSSGGWGTRGAQMLASNLYDQYNNDQQAALTRGPFLNNLLKMIGAG